MDTKYFKSYNGERIKHHILFFIRMLLSLQRPHPLIARLTMYGQKMNIKNTKKKEGGVRR
jgi:hypothetical protein